MLKTRSGVVHEEICGEHLLVATQAARPFCRHWALQLNDAGYFIWKLLEEAPQQREALLLAFSRALLHLRTPGRPSRWTVSGTNADQRLRL